MNQKNSAGNKMALLSLAMDLRRVAIGYHNGSYKTAEWFFIEALKRKEEIDTLKVASYIRTLLIKIEHTKIDKKNERIAEDMLMYSILLQNAAVKIQE
jgi:hypothetical protein